MPNEPSLPEPKPPKGAIRAALREDLQAIADDVVRRPPTWLDALFGNFFLAVRVARVIAKRKIPFAWYEKELGEEICNEVMCEALASTGHYVTDGNGFVRPVF